jgi:regulatory protein
MDSDLYERLINSALHYVSFRPRSVKELRLFLKKKIKNSSKDSDDTLEKVMVRLVDLDYANDRKFAAWLIESRQKHAPKGLRVIRQELLGKGIDRDIIDSLLTDTSLNISVESQRIFAEKAIQKKLHLWVKYPNLTQKKKIYEFLSRRGFDSTTISSVIDGVVGKDYNTPIE